MNAVNSIPRNWVNVTSGEHIFINKIGKYMHRNLFGSN